MKYIYIPYELKLWLKVDFDQDYSPKIRIFDVNFALLMALIGPNSNTIYLKLL